MFLTSEQGAVLPLRWAEEIGKSPTYHAACRFEDTWNGAREAALQPEDCVKVLGCHTKRASRRVTTRVFNGATSVYEERVRRRHSRQRAGKQSTWKMRRQSQQRPNLGDSSGKSISNVCIMSRMMSMLLRITKGHGLTARSPTPPIFHPSPF